MKRNLYEKCFCNDSGKLTLAQKPNIALIVWLISFLLSQITSGTLSNILDIISLLASVTWAGLELAFGVNYFRRVLGLIVLILILAFRI